MGGKDNDPEAYLPASLEYAAYSLEKQERSCFPNKMEDKKLLKPVLWPSFTHCSTHKHTCDGDWGVDKDTERDHRVRASKQGKDID